MGGRCDDAKRLAQSVARELPINGVEIESERGELVVLTRDPERFYAGLPEVVLGAGVQVRELVSADEKLEAVFNYLMSV